MVNGFEAWRSKNTSSPVSESSRALSAWRLIQRNATSVTLWRNDSPLDPQTVHLSHDTSASELGDVSDEGANETYERGVTIFGVIGHPTVADTDIQTGDTLYHDDEEYTVTDIVQYPGSVQAQAVKVTI